MNYIPLILIYAIGIIGYCMFLYMGWQVELVRYYGLRSIDWKMTIPLIPLLLSVLPLVVQCMVMTSLDLLLWVNRETGLNLSFLAGMYGPDMAILK